MKASGKREAYFDSRQDDRTADSTINQFDVKQLLVLVSGSRKFLLSSTFRAEVIGIRRGGISESGFGIRATHTMETIGIEFGNLVSDGK